MNKLYHGSGPRMEALGDAQTTAESNVTAVPSHVTTVSIARESLLGVLPALCSALFHCIHVFLAVLLCIAANILAQRSYEPTITPAFCGRRSIAAFIGNKRLSVRWHINVISTLIIASSEASKSSFLYKYRTNFWGEHRTTQAHQ